MSENNDYFRIFGIFGIFRCFGKFFGKFCESFGHPKPLFYFGSLLDIESPETPKYRESRKAENFRQMHGLSNYDMHL